MDETRIDQDHMVVVRYRLRDDDGNLLDTSEDSEPIAYIHGRNQMLPGLERELEGKAAGDQAEIVVAADDGFGPHREELMVEVPRSNFDFDVKVGVVVEARLPNGRSRHFQVAKVTEDSVTLDGNHPLAGKTLHFDVTVESVRQATPQEIAESESESGDEN